MIEQRNGKEAKGTLTWEAEKLKATAVSGPFGKGALPTGIYTASRSKLLDKPSGSSYCDLDDKCWMQVLDPDFSTARTDLGIHPDGGTAGTEGCIGIKGKAKTWFDAFFKVSGSLKVEVKDAPKVEVLSFRKRVVIDVVGSHENEYAALAAPLGVWIGSQGFDLLTDGGSGVAFKAGKSGRFRGSALAGRLHFERRIPDRHKTLPF